MEVPDGADTKVCSQSCRDGVTVAEVSPSSMRTDWLVRRCREGDASAWSALVHRYSAYVHTVLVRVFGLHGDDAEEVFQAVWLRVYGRLDSLRDDSALRPWIRQVTLNLARDHLDRKRARRDEVLVDDVEPFDDREELMAELDAAMDVHDLLGELPERCTEILTRRFVGDEKYAAIGAALGMTTGQVSGAIHRCLGRLRELLERTEPGTSAVQGT